MTPALTRRLFDAGVIIKGIDGVAEIVVGVLLLFRATTLESWVYLWLAHESALERGDLLSRGLEKLAAMLSSEARTFAIIYLIGHGVLKVFLTVNLLRERMWAFPVSIAFYGLFVAYQLNRFVRTHGPLLLALLLIDLVVIALIWREWRMRSASDATASMGRG